jgi:aryl-alcohol dehydrogenase-like predicted oxidoreductase
MLKKFVIGTAQFGSKYGISNTSGKTKTNEVKKILSLLDKKIYYIDTSTNYGKAEKILGSKRKKKTKIITKISAKKLCLNKTENIKEKIFKQLNQSKKNLKNKSIYAVLINNVDLMLSKKGLKIFESLKEAKKKGLIKKYGYSIYSFSNLKKICNKVKPDIIQCPYNILDRRLIEKNNLNFLKKNTIEVHVRSVFLQGLLLMSKKDMPMYFKKWNNIFNNWEKWVYKSKFSKLSACLNYIYNTKGIDKIVIGVNNTEQLEEIFNLKMQKISIPKHISSKNEKLINPNLWPKKL